MDSDLERLAAQFRRRYSSSPRLFQAPGRVNLIGEHTDYNEGFVMPFAIDRWARVAGAARGDSVIRIYASDLDEAAEIDLDAEPRTRRGNWIDYAEGTARCIAQRFGTIRGADLTLSSTVPIGAGLSSSAAIEMSIGFSLLALNDLDVDREQLALAGQCAEHSFVGTRSGIMDQFSSVFCRTEKAMLLDCRSLDIEQIPLPDEESACVVIDTKVKHDLASSEYNTRREECETAVRILGTRLSEITALRDVSPGDLDAYGDLLPDDIKRRCRHVVSENARTLAAADAFRAKDLATAGRLMSESHQSLRDDYEVSCAELDFLVETAETVDGVYGARMTGGGFGGCTVNLAAKAAVAELVSKTLTRYTEKFGIEPDIYLFRAADGASEVTL